MKILVDIEWYETDKHETTLTQMAAARLTDHYDLVDTFDALIHPDIEVEDYCHIAFNGARKADYQTAMNPECVLGNFLSWVKDDDELYFWHESAAVLLRSFLPGFPNRIKILQERVRQHLPDDISSKGDVYDIARRFGIKPVYPKHCAKNDVTVLLCLLVCMKTDIDDLANNLDNVLNLRPVSRRKMREQSRLASIILGKDINPIDGYRFVYNPKEKLLHRVDCPGLIWSKSFCGFGTLQGAARKYQRGCPCCSGLLEEYHKRRKSLL